MTGEPLIETHDLVCGYGPDAVILEDIELQVHRGEILVLLGGSGSGKSTLLKTLVGLLPPIDGQVRVFGEDLYALDDRRRRELLRRVGMLFQYGALLGSRSIYENIALPVREHTDVPEPVIREMARMKLRLVGLKGLEDRLPSDISGGQRKRVSLVRGTILDPEIVFCDEPSAGLDPIAAAGLDRTLRQFQSLFGMTMVVVTHEMESVKLLADRVVMLHQGAVLATGSLEEVARSERPEVRDFFDRVAPDYAQQGRSVLAALRGEEKSTKAP